MPYDLLLKGGHVLDPGQGLDGTLDIGITDGKIAAIQADIPASEATRVYPGARVTDRYVTPGLIDLHTHVGARRPDRAASGWAACTPRSGGVHSGVTTVVDGGSVGVANIGVFRHHILPTPRRACWCS